MDLEGIQLESWDSGLKSGRAFLCVHALLSHWEPMGLSPKLLPLPWGTSSLAPGCPLGLVSQPL